MLRSLIASIFRKGLLRSFFGLFGITLLIKLFSYAEKLILAYYYGTSYEADVYTLVFTIVMSVFFFFREIVEPGYLNTFLFYRHKGDNRLAWDFFNLSGRSILGVTILLTIIVSLNSEALIEVFAPGFEGKTKETASFLLQITFPASCFLALSTLTSITLNGMKYFVLPALGDLAMKVTIVLSLLLFTKAIGLYATTIGICVGALFKLLVHLYKLKGHVSFSKLQVENGQLKKAWFLTAPLLLGVVFSQISSLVDNMFASTLQVGAISSLSYAKKIVELPVIIFPYILGVVVFPYLSALSIKQNSAKLKSLFMGSLKWITIVFLPLSVFVFIYPDVIVQIVLGRGAFDLNASLTTSLALKIYSIGLLFFALETIIVIFYFSIADTKTPIFIGIVGVIINIGLTYFLTRTIDYQGIAVALVVSKSIKCIWLLYLLKRKQYIDLSFFSSFLFKAVLGTIGFTLTVYLAGLYIDWDQSKTFLRLISLSGIAILGAVIYVFILRICRIQREIPTPDF